MAQNWVMVPGAPGVGIASMYQCHHDEVWLATWGPSMEEGVVLDCSDTPASSVKADYSHLDEKWHCGGIWNCPYALVRGMYCIVLCVSKWCVM